MNRMLIDALDNINNLLAILIVIAGAVAGYMSGQGSGAGIIMVAIGGFAGLVAAAIICGLLATFIEIEKHLRKIATGSLPNS